MLERDNQKKRGMGGNITFKQSLRSHDDDKTAYITKQHFLNETANREYIGTASEQPSRVQTRLTGHFCIGHKHRLKEEEGGREDTHRLAPFAVTITERVSDRERLRDT